MRSHLLTQVIHFKVSLLAMSQFEISRNSAFTVSSMTLKFGWEKKRLVSSANKWKPRILDAWGCHLCKAEIVTGLTHFFFLQFT